MHDSVSSGEQRSGELKEEPMDAESKAERTKAKNKRAQKKFRQKQKERHAELEKSAAELSERLKRTLGEVDQLQNQKKVLEIALSRNVEASANSAAPPTQVTMFDLFSFHGKGRGFPKFVGIAGLG
jgi:predicted transcriptional regulator